MVNYLFVFESLFNKIIILHFNLYFRLQLLKRNKLKIKKINN